MVGYKAGVWDGQSPENQKNQKNLASGNRKGAAHWGRTPSAEWFMKVRIKLPTQTTLREGTESDGDPVGRPCHSAKYRQRGDSSSEQDSYHEDWEMGQLVKHCHRRVYDEGGNPAAPIAIKMMHRKGWWPGASEASLGWWYENLGLMRSYDRDLHVLCAVIQCNWKICSLCVWLWSLQMGDLVGSRCLCLSFSILTCEMEIYNYNLSGIFLLQNFSEKCL